MVETGEGEVLVGVNPKVEVGVVPNAVEVVIELGVSGSRVGVVAKVEVGVVPYVDVGCLEYETLAEGGVDTKYEVPFAWPLAAVHWMEPLA